MDGIKLSQRTELLTSSGNDYVHVVRNGQSYKQKSSVFNSINTTNSVTGGVVYLGGMEYLVWASQYTINSVTYNSYISNTVTLEDGGAEDRFDIFAIQVNTLSNPTTANVVVLQGDEMVNPSLPNINPSTQAQVSFVLVEAGATENNEIITTLVYDENVGLVGGEFDNISLPTSGNLDYSVSPYNGVYSYRQDATSVAVLSWERENNVLVDNDSTFIFAYKGELQTTSSFSIKISNGSNYYYKNITADNITNYGYSPFVGGWQIIQIPFSAFATTNENINSFNTVEFEFLNTPIIDIDRVMIQSGIHTPSADATETIPALYDATVLKLDNHEISEVYSTAPINTTTFTLGDAMVNGGYDRVSITTHGADEFPVIDDARAVLIEGDDFVADTSFYMHVEKTNLRVEYWFERTEDFSFITIPDTVTDDVNALWDDIIGDDLQLGYGTFLNEDGWVFGTPNIRAFFGQRLRNDYTSVNKITTSFKLENIENASGSSYGLTITIPNTAAALYISNNSKGISFNPNNLINSSFVLDDVFTYDIVFNGSDSFTHNVYVNSVLIDTKDVTSAVNFKFQTQISCLANVSLSNIVQKIYI